MTYQGIVFDFNGTLLFDMDLHEIVWRKVAEGHLGRPLADN
jgi:beta-phosphoglucomutase-like phosphatase (HAD superfamily)